MRANPPSAKSAAAITPKATGFLVAIFVLVVLGSVEFAIAAGQGKPPSGDPTVVHSSGAVIGPWAFIGGGNFASNDGALMACGGGFSLVPVQISGFSCNPGSLQACFAYQSNNCSGTPYATPCRPPGFGLSDNAGVIIKGTLECANLSAIQSVSVQSVQFVDCNGNPVRSCLSFGAAFSQNVAPVATVDVSKFVPPFKISLVGEREGLLGLRD